MMGTTAQSINLKSTIRPSAQWALLDVCSTPTWPAYHVDIYFLICQYSSKGVMRYVVSSAAEVETTALFLTAKVMVPLQNTLTEMGWTTRRSSDLPPVEQKWGPLVGPQK